MIRILLIDDHETLRTSLAFVIDQLSDMTVVAQAGSLAEARDKLSGIDVALIDLDLPDGRGTSLIPGLHNNNPEATALILTGSRDQLEYAQAIEHGATGALHKAVSIDQVIRAIRKASAGEPVHSQSEIIAFLQLTAERRARDAETERLLRQLTRREHDLLNALANGLSDREIAERLHVSVRTVQSHMLNLMEKFDVHSRLQVLILAIRHGIIRIHHSPED